MPGELQAASQAFGQLTGVAQTIGGFISAKKANKNLANLFKKRKAFQTPSEIFDIVNAQEANQAGFSPETLEYLTTGANSGLSSALGAATKLGADPNAISSLLNNYSRDLFRIGGENELVKMKKFDGLMNAWQLLAGNKEAEWLSKENMLKDQMAAVGDQVKAAEKNISSGINLVTNATAAAGSGNMYGGGGTPGTPGNLGLGITSPVNNGVSGVSGTQGLSPSQLLKLKQLIDSGALN